MNSSNELHPPGILERSADWAGAGRWLVKILGSISSRPRRRLQLCESLPLGERRFVAVVEFERQRFLIGGSNGSLCLLAMLPAGEASAQSPDKKETP